jgi:regulator of nucleoside diphosphate kinase
MVKETNIYITKPDHERLTKLIEFTREREGDANRESLNRLEEELERAEIVEQKDIPPDVITMRSTVSLKDLDTGEEMIYWLAFPTEANYDEGKISILAPIGTAMLGYRRGDVIEWEVPSGVLSRRTSEVRLIPSLFSIPFSRWAKLLAGLAFIGVGLAFTKQANLGLAPGTCSTTGWLN